MGLAGNVVLGIVGAVVAGWLLPAIGIGLGGGIVGAIITAMIGAIIVLLVISLFKRAEGPRPRRARVRSAKALETAA